MWDNPRLLNLLAGMLIGLAVLGFLAVGSLKLLHAGLFPVRELVLTAAPAHITRAQIEDAVRGRIAGDFFAVDLREVRGALEQLPWVRRAAVRRVWPGRLEVTLEEHVALARWGDDALVNTYGEKFSAASGDKLPLFIGPAGSEKEVAGEYARFSAELAPLGVAIDRVVLTARFAWQLRLADGLYIMLGRDVQVAEERLRRFVGAYDATLRKIPRRHEYVDLRYPNGFALRIPELKG
ncbi:MAG TPA: cell division protein FtsQ/DivIB [Burkholderiales bacterium]|jgi:cell division protein FtsQ|nr:cell division protein FtsQ/DivIB [Burkholderiales bacterium]